MLGDAQFAQAERLGAGRAARARGHGRRARALRRLRPLRRRPPVQRDRRGRRARRRRPRRRGLRLRADVLDLDDDRGVPEPAADLGARARLLHDARRSASRRSFDFPEGIGPVECVNVEHEEVVLIPRWVDCRRVTFKYGLGDEFIDVLQHAAQARARLDRAGRRARRVEVAPRDVVAAALPEPGDARRPDDAAAPARARCVTGTGKDGRPRATYLYHVVDNEETMRARRLPGGRLADGDQRGRRDGAAGRGRVVGRRRARPGGVRRRRRSWSCWPTTAARTGCRRR